MSEQQNPDVQAPAVAPESPSDNDGFEAALREFEDAAPSSPPERGNGNGAGVEPPDPAQRADILREQIDATRQLGELRVWALGVEQERLERREREDAAAIFEQGNEYVAGFDHLPADFAERWLRAEYSIDAELHHAWDNRHESADAMRWCRRCLRHALGRLRKAAEHVPDHEATETRAIIAAAMMRGGTPPPATPPDYSGMSDSEFRAAVKKEHGFTPRL